jgi:hypothetical protein
MGTVIALLPAVVLRYRRRAVAGVASVLATLWLREWRLMLQKYKEIFYGGLFGLGEAVLDTFNGRSDGESQLRG